MCAPASRNRIAPRSIPTLGSRNGSARKLISSDRLDETRLTLVEQPESRVERAIKVLEEQWFAVDGIYRDVFSAILSGGFTTRYHEDQGETRTISHELKTLSLAISVRGSLVAISTVQAQQLGSIVEQRIWAVSGLLYQWMERTWKSRQLSVLHFGDVGWLLFEHGGGRPSYQSYPSLINHKSVSFTLCSTLFCYPSRLILIH